MENHLEIEGYDVTPHVGSFIILDKHHIGQPLGKSDWDQAQFRLPMTALMNVFGPHHKGLACNVRVTGRKLNWDIYEYGPAVRVKLTFVGDGEPNEYANAWMGIKVKK